MGFIDRRLTILNSVLISTFTDYSYSVKYLSMHVCVREVIGRIHPCTVISTRIIQLTESGVPLYTTAAPQNTRVGASTRPRVKLEIFIHL